LMHPFEKLAGDFLDDRALDFGEFRVGTGNDVEDSQFVLGQFFPNVALLFVGEASLQPFNYM